MSSTTPPITTCLITGANRGIGAGLTAAYLLRPHHLIIATARHPTSPSSHALHSLPHHPTTTLLLLPLDTASPPSIAALFTTLRHTHHITTFDLVIANAGIGYATGVPLAEESRDTLRAFVETNAWGPWEVFGGAVGGMREASKGGRRKARFVCVSSNLGCLGAMEGGVARGYGAYGASKAMGNFLVRWVAKEEEVGGSGVVAFMVHPGPVKTDMGENAIKQLEEMGYDLDLKWLEVEESVRGMMTLIDEAEEKNYGGRFLQYDGTELPW